ncbi:hypothetical protein KDX16_31050 [Burkholderia vietnamiensis]|uniref:hypothetical protein n=1 Tax=Burkholderia vietnamiensis TaxID=60552 RepID=UPI000A958C8D|nr:hypothetical protein [Burkholderia vietnamiensis]MBR7920239.1 hypothetical protein [Burkholderia vietnamiensis]MBR8205327.1 hypothetical protein [Burkholderia vietnamiensis]HDR9133249.1 hypothetical protein [Burkholderia vietnamiensis]
MNLSDAQQSIETLSMDGTPGVSEWNARAVRLLAALLPVLAWPGTAAMRGDSESLLDFDEMIARANLRTGDLIDLAWEGVRNYLATVPGLYRDPTGAIAVSGSSTLESAREHLGYLTMQFGR